MGMGVGLCWDGCTSETFEIDRSSGLIFGYFDCLGDSIDFFFVG